MAQQTRLNVDTYVQTHGAATFTVDLTQDAVELILKPLDECEFASPQFGLLRMGDNFIILSMGFCLPFGFELEKVVDDTTMYQNISLYYQVAPDPDPVTLYNSFVPFPNYEYSINMYIKNTQDIILKGRFNTYPDPVPIKISMAGVPDIFDTKEFSVPIFVKIQHKGLL